MNTDPYVMLMMAVTLFAAVNALIDVAVAAFGPASLAVYHRARAMDSTILTYTLLGVSLVLAGLARQGVLS